MGQDSLTNLTRWNTVGSLQVRAGSARVEPALGDRFGTGMAQHLHLSNAPMIGLQSPNKARLAVTRLTSRYALPERTTPFQRDPFFTVQLYLKPTLGGRLWHGGRSVEVDPLRYEGSVTIHDFDREPSVFLGSGFDILQFYVPREALDEFSLENQLPPSGDLVWPHGAVDLGFRQLAMNVLPAFEQPAHSSQLHFDYLILACHAYVAHHYGGVASALETHRGGLAPWQKDRATEMLRETLHGNISLAEIARHCGLSSSHFAHAFKESFGRPPHRWLIDHRVSVAKDLLLKSFLPVVDIALRAGFSDQTSFYRSFKRVTGTSPHTWRRNRVTGQYQLDRPLLPTKANGTDLITKGQSRRHEK